MDSRERGHMPQETETGYSRVDYSRRRSPVPLIALLLALLLPAALFAAQYTPKQDSAAMHIAGLLGEDDHGVPVQGVMDIEDAWDIEDARQPAQEPLLTRMYNGGAILGYDRESRTFYCTIGTELGDSWPELFLTASGEDEPAAAFIDDYTYDFPADAVAEGYRYELLVYTDTAFEYVGVVFTGLPLVTLHTDENAAIEGDADVGAAVHIASAEHDALYSRAKVHRRGGGSYMGVPKHSYRFEFRGLTYDGREKSAARSALGMEADTDWLLVSNASDVSAMRNHLCWNLWRDFKPGRQIAELDSRLIELFVGDEYMGVYQLMEYVDPEKELMLMGGNPDTDICVRMITLMNDSDRPVLDRVDWDNHKLELRYAPKTMTPAEAFAAFDIFTEIELTRTLEMSDEEFAGKILAHFDVQELLDYFLFIQVYGLTDNVTNNLYVWALRQSDGSYRYRISPWDMDQSLGSAESIIADGDLMSWEMKMVNRMLDMNLADSRNYVTALFEQKRQADLSDDVIYAYLLEQEEWMNATGAYLRETEKWRGGAEYLDLAEIRARVIGFQSTLTYYLRELWPVNPQ